MAIEDHLTETCQIWTQATSWSFDGAEEFGTMTLAASSAMCRVVPEGAAAVRIFLSYEDNAWHLGDQEARIVLNAVGSQTFVVKPLLIEAALGIAYGQIEYPTSLHGTHMEVIAQREFVS